MPPAVLLRTSHAVDARVAEVMSRQGGVASFAQLLECGTGRSSIPRRVDAGRLERVLPRVYGLPGVTLSERGRAWAAVLAVGGTAAVTGTWLAVEQEVWRGRHPATIELVRTQRHDGFPGVTVRRAAQLTKHLTDLARLPVVVLPRMVLDLGDELTPWQLANVLHQASARSDWDLGAVRAILAGYRGRRAVTPVRHALTMLERHSHGTESFLEDRAIKVVGRAGWPEPGVTELLHLPGCGFPVDLRWDELQFVLEIDGRAWHERAATAERDRARDEAIAQNPPWRSARLLDTDLRNPYRTPAWRPVLEVLGQPSGRTAAWFAPYEGR